MAWREHRVLLVTGAWEHPWQRNKVTNYKAYDISMMEDDNHLEKHYKMDMGQGKRRWRGAVGLRCWTVRCLRGLCKTPYLVLRLGSALGGGTWGNVLCRAGQLGKAKHVLSLQERGWKQAWSYPSLKQLPQGCQQSQRCPGRWGRQLWEDGHHFGRGSAGWLQVVVAALQDTWYQHLYVEGLLQVWIGPCLTTRSGSWHSLRPINPLPDLSQVRGILPWPWGLWCQAWARKCESRNRWPLAHLVPPKLLRQAARTKPHPETREVSVTWGRATLFKWALVEPEILIVRCQ